MSVRHWPCELRPREKLLSDGAAGLSDAELLAVIVRCGGRGSSAIALAQQLLVRFGSLRELSAAACSDFCLETGAGRAQWATLQAALEISRRSLKQALRQRALMHTPALVKEFLRLWLRDQPRECFAALFLDTQHQLIQAETLFQGTVSQTAVYPRELARRSLELNASALVVAHNHPSGLCEPSMADRALTAALRAALQPLDINLVDHLIVADADCFSFAEAGLI
jgi:DNA repair protein RadC